MAIHKRVVASAYSLISLSLAVSAPVWSQDDPVAPVGCAPQILSAQTHFPQEAQRQGEGGVVRVHVVLDSGGHVTKSHVARSSGSRSLDQAAEKSVSLDWRFDVSQCAASTLPVGHEIDVVYRRVPRSFSASINHRGIQYAKQAATDSQCTVVPGEKSSNIISCIQQPTPTKVGESSLATR